MMDSNEFKIYMDQLLKCSKHKNMDNVVEQMKDTIKNFNMNPWSETQQNGLVHDR